MYVCIYAGGRWCGYVARIPTKCALSPPERCTISRATLTRLSRYADTISCPSYRYAMFMYKCLHVCVAMHCIPYIVVLCVERLDFKQKPLFIVFCNRTFALPEMKISWLNVWGWLLCMYCMNVCLYFMYFKISYPKRGVGLKYSMYVLMYITIT